MLTCRIDGLPFWREKVQHGVGSLAECHMIRDFCRRAGDSRPNLRPALINADPIVMRDIQDGARCKHPKIDLIG